jgi:alanyl-tRNA synthetase
VLRVPAEQLPSTADRFFEEWKQRGKENEQLKEDKAKFSSLVFELGSIIEVLEVSSAGDHETVANRLSSLETVANRLSSLAAAFKKRTDVTVTPPAATAVVEAIPPTVQIVESTKLGSHHIKILSWGIDADLKELLHTSQELLNDNAVVILGGVRGGQASIVIRARADVVKIGFNAAIIVKEACSLLGGSGGGRPDRAQGGGPYADKINEAVNEAKKLVREKLEAIGQTGLTK